MCGIVGIVASPEQDVTLTDQELRTMRDAMDFRGPDDSGLVRFGNVAFGHRRLAIRDLEGGRQPWVSDDNQAMLVYNGELYNDIELRQELSLLGYHFKSRCDTEVVLAAYRQWGPDCVKRFRGMFAFAVYDFKENALFLARDRFGIKPLFLTEFKNQLVFSSSIASLLNLPGYSPEPDYQTISHYLTTFRITLGRRTMYSGIRQLLPGETLLMKDENIRIEKYWSYPVKVESRIPFEDASCQFESLLKEAVSVRMVSDVPVGLFLSGGVDSNLVARYLSEASDEQIIARCGGGSTKDNKGDFSYARECASLFDIQFSETHVDSQNYYRSWDQMIEKNKTPLSTPTDVIIYHLSREIKKNVGVVLGGEGADELLCGYAIQHWAGNDYDRFNQLKNSHLQSDCDEVRLFRKSLVQQYGRDQFLSRTDHYFALNSLIPMSVKKHLFNPHIWKNAEEDLQMMLTYRELFDEYEHLSTAEANTAVLHQVNLEALLSRLDTSTMLAGLEARVPYTDHHLVEKMCEIPFRHKIDVSQTERSPYLASAELAARGSLNDKKLLRHVASNVLPKKLAYRKKDSFSTPVLKWMGDDWKDDVTQTLKMSEFAKELFQPAALNEIIENPEQAGMWLWPIMNLAKWGDQAFAA
jgi:asparagine synthase (glutamine-hydrolysing)